MLKGAFKQMKHIHRFLADGSGTKMVDEFEFVSPFGFLGKLADSIFLKRYMKNFLINKNKELKYVAESQEWKKIINETKS